MVRDQGVGGSNPLSPTIYGGRKWAVRLATLDCTKSALCAIGKVLASLDAGDSVEDILSDFPSLKAEDIRAAIAFAAASAEEDLPVPAVPHLQ